MNKLSVGDLVKVVAKSPRFSWGQVTPKCVGRVLGINGDTVTINFPKNTRWKGLISELGYVEDYSSVNTKDN